MKYYLTILVLGLLSKCAFGATIYVPTDYPTVQDGINAATVGDSVILEAGTYNDYNIQMKYGIHLYGETGNPEDVTIDATENGSVIICEDFTGEAPTTIEALTISSSADSNTCFGIWCENCPNIIIRNGIVKNNGNTGIISYNSSVSIEDNEIFDNGHVGVACYGDSSQTVTIRNNAIYNNRNMYTGEGLGGGIYCSGVRLDLSGNLIYNNRSGVGGGLFAIWCKAVYASNNTIANNRADNYAGGIVLILEPNDSAVIENSILWADSANEIFVIADSGAYYDIRHCDIMGGWEGETNFDLDPKFCDTAFGDFSIDITSPCAPENNDSGLLIGAFGYGCVTVDIDEYSNILPYSFDLRQNYPNPFNPITTIKYILPQMTHVRVDVFNLMGQMVRTIVNRVESSGFHTVTWDGTDIYGQQVSTGVYLYRFQAGNNIQTKKMLLLK